MFAKETFDYPELEEHPLLCNHLGEIMAQSNYVSYSNCENLMFNLIYISYNL